jgi:hypothetical protein
VETVAVAVVLAAYNWPRDTDRYRRVAAFTEAFFNKFAEFQKPGRHPKWKDASPPASLRGWKRFPAAEEWLARNIKQTATAAASASIEPARPREPAAKTATDDSSEQDNLLSEFVEWKKAQSKR